MRLSDLTIEPRIRAPWAAIDLGESLIKHFWLRAFALYLTIALPIFLILRTVLGADSILAILVLWWLKPMFERPLLHFLSMELFGQSCGYFSTLAKIRQWLFTRALHGFSIARLTPTRGMMAPVLLLENADLRTYRQRAKVLGIGYSNTASWHNVVMFHFEAFFYLAGLALLSLFAPDLFASQVYEDFTANRSNVYIDAFTLLAMAAVAPFYVASSFMMYISKRIELEGWDIELCFRDWVASTERHVQATGLERTDA
ncbi:MAG: hypothetical protein AAF431_07315 [Pseudomonadota bacterium]